jgi:segregation and condensation protein A
MDFRTEIFTGPLDLLLKLISKHKVSIADIEITALVEQFLEYIDFTRESDIEIAGEFMEMAARLILIKTSSLLPREEAELLQKELEGKLIDYALCQRQAKLLYEMRTNLFVRTPLELEGIKQYEGVHSALELRNLYRQLQKKGKPVKDTPDPIRNPVVATGKPISVYTKIVYVLRRLKKYGTYPVDELYLEQKRSEQVAVFLALLELCAYCRIRFSDDNRFLERYAAEGTAAEPLQ